jgi:hypothetical protein
MNFTEAVTEVLLAVKRPDKIDRARAKINAAITFYCLDNEFSRDFTEQAITLDAQEYTQSFTLDVMTRFRKFKYIKRGGTKDFLTLLGNAEREAKCDWQDRYYIAGLNVNIYLKVLAGTLDVGYYSYPPVLNDTTDNNSHWLLDVAPWMIIDRAIGEIFREIGDEKSFQVMSASAREQYMAARKDLGISTQ